MLSTPGYVPDRGDVVWVTLDPKVGREQAGRRPALVLSPAAYNRRVGLAVLCPITSRVKGYTFEVLIPAGLPLEGCVLSDQVKSVDWRGRQAIPICKVPEAVVHDVLQKLDTLLSWQRWPSQLGRN